MYLPVKNRPQNKEDNKVVFENTPYIFNHKKYETYLTSTENDVEAFCQTGNTLMKIIEDKIFVISDNVIPPDEKLNLLKRAHFEIFSPDPRIAGREFGIRRQIENFIKIDNEQHLTPIEFVTEGGFKIPITRDDFIGTYVRIWGDKRYSFGKLGFGKYSDIVKLLQDLNLETNK